jgi:tetratricopeptide (TPR) repeat protein
LVLSVAFVVGTVVWGVFALQDYVLLGLQRPVVVPVENTVYAVAKLLMLLGVASLLPSTGIFIAWIVPLAINVPGVNWLIFRRYLKDWALATAEPTVRPRDIVRFTSVDYVGNLLSQTAWNLLPLLVLTVLGASLAASFYVAWTVTNGLDLVANSFATSLLVEGSANPGRLGQLTRGMLTRSVVVTVTGAVVFGLGARLVLSVYGNGYAVRASLLLGLLAAGSVFYGLLAIAFSLDRIVGRVGRATVTRLIVAILTLGGSWLLLPRLGTTGVGVAWLGANLLMAIARMPTIFRAARLPAGVEPARHMTGTPVARQGPSVPVLAGQDERLAATGLEDLASRANLAPSYRQIESVAVAVAMHERTLADREQRLGPHHPQTVACRANLAYAYRQGGQPAKAIPLYEQIVADWTRLLGPDHPRTLRSSNYLASAYYEAGRLADAIPLYEQTLADRRRLLGPDHPSTLRSSKYLATVYHEAGRLAEAIPLYEQVLAGWHALLGPDDPSTLRCSNYLANAYGEAGRQSEAVRLYQQTLVRCRRVLGNEHALTRKVRRNLSVVKELAASRSKSSPDFSRAEGPSASSMRH